MSVHISTFGIILVLPFYALAVFVLYRLWSRFKASPWRWSLPLLLPVVAVLPFADEFWIAWNFERACKDAGVKVYRRVEVEGYADATSGSRRRENSPTTPQRISKDAASLAQLDKDMTGFRFKEQLLSDGSAWHVERRRDGIYAYVLDRPEARYHYRYADPRQWAPAGFQINRMEMQVVDNETGEVLGRELSFERFPGFIEGLWIRFLGSGQVICNRPLDDHTRTVQTGAAYSYALIPKKQN